MESSRSRFVKLTVSVPVCHTNYDDNLKVPLLEGPSMNRKASGCLMMFEHKRKVWPSCEATKLPHGVLVKVAGPYFFNVYLEALLNNSGGTQTMGGQHKHHRGAPRGRCGPAKHSSLRGDSGQVGGLTE